MKEIRWQEVLVILVIGLLSACGGAHVGTGNGESAYPDGGPAGSTVASDTNDSSGSNTQSGDTPDSNSGADEEPGSGPTDTPEGDLGDDGSSDDEDIDDAIDDELGEGFDDDDFGDDFDEDLGGLDEGAEGGCGFPYMCATDSADCSSFWEGTVVASETCSDGGVCCDPFSGESSDSSDEASEVGPPTADPISRDTFCAKILECVMPEGATTQDCDDVYDDAYCGNWDYYLGCMDGCLEVECSEEDFGTAFVLCEGDCFDSYCG